MNNLPKLAQIIIVGGGVMGASTAYHLALKGCRDIVLLERAPFFGTGATGKCAGGIRHQFSTEINVRLSQLSLPLFSRFEEELGQPIDLRWCGYLFILTTEQDAKTFRQNVSMQNKLGVATEWLDSGEIRRRVPSLRADDILAGTFHAGDGLADPNSVVQGYINAAKKMGVQTFTDTPLIDVELQSGKIAKVVTPAGIISTPVLINAAGPWSAVVSKMVGHSLPVVPVRRQMLTTTAVPSIKSDFPFVIDFAQSLYFHREGSGVLTGMSNPDQRPGFDERIDEEWEIVHMDAAIKRLPLLGNVGRVNAWAGLYEVTPDAHPIIGPISDIEGYFVITGFSGHGFMHGPGAGLLMSEMVLEGKTQSLDISALSFDRYIDRNLVDEYNVI
jgi:sarcosine oxidase subunit beta